MQKHKTDDTTGISYTLTGDYYIPDLILPAEKQYPIGKYGRMRLRYLRENKKVLYINLLTSCKLSEHLHDVDTRANTQVNKIVSSFAIADGTDENLKAKDQMKWVGLMNNYRYSAEEIVISELIMNADMSSVYFNA